MKPSATTSLDWPMDLELDGEVNDQGSGDESAANQRPRRRRAALAVEPLVVAFALAAIVSAASAAPGFASPSATVSASPGSPARELGSRSEAPRAANLFSRLTRLRAHAEVDGSVRVLVRRRLGPAASGGREPMEAALAGTAFAVRREYQRIPWVALEIGTDAADAVKALARAGEILDVTEDRLGTTSLLETAPVVQAPEAWAAGYDGSGQTIAVIDTGIETDHAMLAGKVLAEACFSGGHDCPNGATTQIGAGAGAPCAWAQGCRHGTHVAGIAAGHSKDLSGIARGANLVSIQVFSRFDGTDSCGSGAGTENPCALTYSSDQIAGLEHVLELTDQFPIASVNLSLGSKDLYASQAACDEANPAMRDVVAALVERGVAVVAAAGNAASPKSLSLPACLSQAISVGAVDDSLAVPRFSNSAAFLTLLAPGVSVLSAAVGGGYRTLSGTSQAAPHVAGAVAILKQKSPSASVATLRAAMTTTGTPITDSGSDITTPLLRIAAALEALPGEIPAGVQATPDSRSLLVSKDVGNERWAISYDLDDDTVAGNVFRRDGGDPQFVSCRLLSRTGGSDPELDLLTLQCSGSTRCLDAACSPATWSDIGIAQLPWSFFLPRAEAGATTATAHAATQPSSAATTSAPTAASTPAGVQVSPDRAHTLLSKDVDGSRWAIVLDASDGSVSGNVFPIDGGTPRFVWCRRVSPAVGAETPNGEVTLACEGSEACHGSTCATSPWTPLGDVTLPTAFFLPP